jgi:hypothetical protein
VGPVPEWLEGHLEEEQLQPGHHLGPNGVLNMRLHTNTSGVPQVSAPQPKINGPSDFLRDSRGRLSSLLEAADRGRRGNGPDMADNTYEIVLGPAALLVIVHMRTDKIKEELADALRVELEHSENPRTEATYGNVRCSQQVLSTGYTAVFNPMQTKELRDLSRQEGRKTLSKGYYVFDLLSADKAIIRAY